MTDDIDAATQPCLDYIRQHSGTPFVELARVITDLAPTPDNTGDQHELGA